MDEIGESGKAKEDDKMKDTNGREKEYLGALSTNQDESETQKAKKDTHVKEPTTQKTERDSNVEEPEAHNTERNSNTKETNAKTKEQNSNVQDPETQKSEQESKVKETKGQKTEQKEQQDEKLKNITTDHELNVGQNTSNDNKSGGTVLAKLPDKGKTHASANLMIKESDKYSSDKALMREELVRKIEELEKQRAALTQRQLIKEIHSLQGEIKKNGPDEKKDFHVTFEDQNDIPSSIAPIATDISSQEKIDHQLKDLDEKIDRASKRILERSNKDDLSSLTTDELRRRVLELKERKEFLHKSRQKNQVITNIQDLHKEVTAMKKKLKGKDDQIISSDHLKVFPFSPSEVDIYWNPEDYPGMKYYVISYRESEESSTEFQTIRPEVTQTSHLIENLKPGTTYEIKFEAMTKEDFRIITEPLKISTYKPITGFALIIANHSGFHLSHLKNIDGIPDDVNNCRRKLETFGFEVVLEENLTGNEVVECVEKHSINLEHHQSFICVLIGYTYNGYYYGTEGMPVLVQRILEPLRVIDKQEVETVATIEAKPKIIFIDTFKVRERIVEDLDDSFQPREVQFRSSSNKTIEASWKRPKLSKRKLKGFKLLLKNTSTARIHHIPFVDKQNGSYFFRFNKLVPNTEYNLEIFSEYEDGVDGKPVKARLTTFQPRGLQPWKLSVEAVSTTQIYVYWMPPVMSSRTILGYKVSIRDQTKEEYSEKITTYTCMIFNDLNEDTEYNISVRTIVRGEVIDFETEVKDEESKPVYIDITTLTDRTPFIMSGEMVNYVLEEPDFFFASAVASNVSDSSDLSFLNTIIKHLNSKHEKKDLQSIMEDVKREIMCSTDLYETPQSMTTLRQPVFFGKQSPVSPPVEHKEEFE